jgi:hypothetical protein
LRALVPKRGYLMATAIAPRASGAQAADLLKRAVTNADAGHYTPLLLTFASRIGAAPAAEILAALRQGGGTATGAIRSANYQWKEVVGALISRCGTLAPPEITELINVGSREHGERRISFALALSGHVASVSPGQVPAALDLLEGTFLSGGTLTGPGGATDIAAVVARPIVAAMIALGERLERDHARAALARWFRVLERASAEEVTLLGPLLAAFVRSGDEQLIFDLAKRPDFNALPQMQDAVLGALRKLLNYEGTGLWLAAREAARHQLDPVRAPPRNWEYPMRLH